MAIEYEVSRRAPDQVKPDLLRLWRHNLRVEGEADDRFAWTYDDPPEVWRHVFVLAMREPDREPRVIGTAGAEIRPFASGTRTLRVAVGCNLAVDVSHRTVRPALELVRAVRRGTRADFDLTYHLPNERAQPLYRRAGYHDLGPTTRYVRVLRHAPYVEKVVAAPLLARVTGPVVDAFVGARHVASRRRAARELEIEWLARVDGRFDALWERARADYPIVARRDAAWLGWRFAHTHGPTRIASLVERARPRALRAYAVVEHIERVAHVRDVFGPLGDLDALLALLPDALRREGVTSASFRYLGSPTLVALLHRHGFRPRDAKLRAWVDPGDGLTERERAMALQASSWHLTEFDEDS